MKKNPTLRDTLKAMWATVRDEARATWAVGSNFDRFLMLFFAACVPYDIAQGGSLDLFVAFFALFFIWQSIKLTRKD